MTALQFWVICQGWAVFQARTRGTRDKKYPLGKEAGKGKQAVGCIEDRTRVPAKEWTHKESRSEPSHGAKHMRWDLGKAVAL